MTPKAFCQSGTAEGFKACWHGALGLLAFGACAYNVVAFAWRPRRHLFCNAALYGTIAVLEARKVSTHLEE